MPEQKLTEEQKQLALGTVIFQPPDCKECGTTPMCHDTCYEKTRVEDAEKQALATASFYQDKIAEARQQAFGEVVGFLSNKQRHNADDSVFWVCFLLEVWQSKLKEWGIE
jgi:hypothetical protein